MQQAPLRDLAAGIGLNDKFLFTRELFKSNPSLYQQTVARINQSRNLEEALEWLHSRFQWDESLPAVQKFWTSSNADIPEAMGKLYVVPTPVGNLEDITLRAIRVLKEVDSVLAEDTRTSGFLLRHLGIEKKMQPFHKFNEHKALEQLVERLRLGETWHWSPMQALRPSPTRDSCWSGPAWMQTSRWNVCPGQRHLSPLWFNRACPVSGFALKGSCLSRKEGKKDSRNWLPKPAPSSFLSLLPGNPDSGRNDRNHGPDRKACLCRELSKKFEETIRGTLQEIKDILQQRDALKGEMVLMVSGRDRKSEKTSDES